MGTNLELLYNLDESAMNQAPGGLDAEDSSGNSNHGTAESSMTDSDFVNGKIVIALSDTEKSVIQFEDGVNPSEGGILTLGDTNTRTIIKGGDVADVGIRFDLDSTEVGRWDGSTKTFIVDNGETTSQQIIARAAAGASENIQEWQDGSENILAYVDENGDSQFGHLTIGTGEAGVDYTLTFDGETNDGLLTWMEDEDYFSFADDVAIATLTEGSIPYIGVSGVVSENNSMLMWDTVNNTLQLGNLSSEKTITISGVEYKSHLKVNEQDDGHLAMLQLHRHSATDALGAQIVTSRSNSSGAGHGVVTDGQNLFRIASAGWTDDDYDIFAQINIEVDGTSGANDAPGRIVFLTTPDGTNVSQESYRIKQDQNILIATDNELQLRDTAITISSATDGHMDLAADVSVDFNTPVLDLSNQTVDVTLNNAVDSVNFDSNTLSIDASNNRIGIGDADPDTKLEVNGAITIQEISSDPTDPAEGKAVFWMGDGTGSGADGDLLYMEQSGATVATGNLKWTDFTPSSITVNASDGTTGNVSDTQTMFDGNVFQIEELAATPGYDVEFEFSNVDKYPTMVVTRWLYSGSSTHDVTWDIWNYSTSAWDTLRSFQDSRTYEASMTMYIPRNSNGNYVSLNNAKVRVYHRSGGVAVHYIQIDYVGLTHSLQGVL
jgi:hypothetical protein